MSHKDQWIVWISQDAGRRLLGLGPAPNDEPSRFCIIGKMTGQAFNLGFWVEVDTIQEWTIPDNIVVGEWTVTPKTCLIPSSVVGHVQLKSAKEQVGFTKTK
jgi:hypothetical protein